MRVLAIETSCDDTAVAILEVPRQARYKQLDGNPKIPHFKVLSNIISSQTKIHKKYGGVVPSLAKRAHQKNLVPVFTKALGEAKLLNVKSQMPNAKSSQKSKIKNIEKILDREPELLGQFLKTVTKIKKPNLDLIAVTHGPGLEPALWAGINFARTLSYFWNVPLVGINHMEGHIAANFLPQKVSGISNSKFLISNSDKLFPAVVLAVSGGHTQLILVKSIGRYKLIGETVDDAAGEGFDKAARMLGLGFPGGPEIAKSAKGGNPKAFDLPRPMLHSKDYNFSFSGLKTAILYKIKEICGIPDIPHRKLTAGVKRDLAASFQQAVVDVLIAKTMRAAKEYKAKTVMLGGGVAANEELRKQLEERIRAEIPETQYLAPSPQLATDNAAMIAAAAYFRKKEASLTRWKTLKANGGLSIDSTRDKL